MLKIFLSGSTSFLGSNFISMYSDKYDIFGFSPSDKDHPLNMLDKKDLAKKFYDVDPDVIIHLAAIVDSDAEKTYETNVEGTKNIVELATEKELPFIFMSSEAVYGGKEDKGGYIETDEYQPRSSYGRSKAESERIILENLQSFLILRGHRFIGTNEDYDEPKQFPDTLDALEKGEEVHLDSDKLFKPTFINNIADIFSFYIENDIQEQKIFNVGIDKKMTYYDLVTDIAQRLGLDTDLIHPDGEERGWPDNSTLDLSKLYKSDYPSINYDEFLETLEREYKR